MNKEDFIRISAEIFPHVKEIQQIMGENGIEGLCSINADADVYAAVEFHAAPFCLYHGDYGYTIIDRTGEKSESEMLDGFPGSSDRHDELIRLEERVDMLTEYVQNGWPLYPDIVAHYLNFKLRGKGNGA